jgi:hypothetical protein
MKDAHRAHGQTDPNTTGPRPKKITEGTIEGIAVGRDKIIVPPEQVYELAAIGCTDREIARFFGVKEDTLRYNFAEKLVKGREDLNQQLRRAMLRNALSNMNVTMQIWLSKNILGMSDSPVDAEANQPLPWNESDNTVEIEEYDEREENADE